ncbi:LamG-like jellyroll fold domain-containing protein [Acinetobacter thermotolerans]|uniref:LamG-like jellyroll fold domain-containing protein n=1 Tax=Acinetobacter thermotolerans TaxID=3151487 RepID=UPI00325B2216
MTNRLELNWKLDGFVDEQRYYCSETPIDLENLPVPKAIIAGDARTYTDTAIEVGKTYYVAVGSVNGGIEKVSQELEIYAGGDPHWDKVVALLHFNGNLTDATGRVWSANQSLQFAPGVFGEALLRSNTSLIITTPASSDFLFDGDFTIEAFLKNTGGTNPLFVYGNNQNEFIPLYLDSATSGRVFVKGNNLIVGISLPSGFFHYALTRKDGVVRAFVDGVMQGTANYGDTLGITAGDIYLCSGNGYYHLWTGQIDELRITKGVARYTADFTPPDAPFPSL